jgi:hypothetical protein
MTTSHPAGKDTNGLPRKDIWPPLEGTTEYPPEKNNLLVKLLMDVRRSQD